MNQDQITVIGGGLIGLSIAHNLALHGKQVRVLSRNKRESAGFVAAGMLAPHAEGLSGPLLALSQLSLEKTPQWVTTIENSSQISCDLKESGIIVPFTNNAECKTHTHAKIGNILNRKELEQEIPGISQKWKR